MGARRLKAVRRPMPGLLGSPILSGTDRKEFDLQRFSGQYKRVGVIPAPSSWQIVFRAQLLFLFVLTALLACAPTPGCAAEARVAVAANFSAVAQRLAQQYQQQSGNHIELSSASTGSLYAQITQGAPFDVFLSADASTPQRLVREGLAVRVSLFNYATGRLATGTSTSRRHGVPAFRPASPSVRAQQPALRLTPRRRGYGIAAEMDRPAQPRAAAVTPPRHPCRR